MVAPVLSGSSAAVAEAALGGVPVLAGYRLGGVGLGLAVATLATATVMARPTQPGVVEQNECRLDALADVRGGRWKARWSHLRGQPIARTHAAAARAGRADRFPFVPVASVRRRRARPIRLLALASDVSLDGAQVPERGVAGIAGPAGDDRLDDLAVAGMRCLAPPGKRNYPARIRQK